MTCRGHLPDFSTDPSKSKGNLDSAMRIIEVSRSCLELSKLPSSDTQILKNIVIHIRPQKNLERLNQLEKDIILVRNQLYGLTNDKNSTANIITELQVSYKQLLRKNEKQEKEIQSLKYENKKLLKQRRRVSCEEDLSLLNAKKYLELCENKLTKLDMTMTKLLKSYQHSIENEEKYEMENRDLVKTNNELKNTVMKIINHLEEFPNNTVDVKDIREEQSNNLEEYSLQLSEAEECILDTQLTYRNSLLNEMEKIHERYQKVVTQQTVMESKLHILEERTNELRELTSKSSTVQYNEIADLKELTTSSNRTDSDKSKDVSQENVEVCKGLHSSEPTLELTKSCYSVGTSSVNIEMLRSEEIACESETVCNSKTTAVKENLSNKTDDENENQNDTSEGSGEIPVTLLHSKSTLELTNTHCSSRTSVNNENITTYYIPPTEEERFEGIHEVDGSETTSLCENEKSTDNPSDFLPVPHHPMIYEDYELECFCESCEEC